MGESFSSNPFAGVWHRRFIQFDQGPRETAQRVLWIQSWSAFADVRSPLLEGALTAERYHSMNWRQRFDTDLLGFAGDFTWHPGDASSGTCTWHHHIAITPRSRPDTSTYQWLSPEEFLEFGTCDDDQGEAHPFVEHWQRVHTGSVAVWRLDSQATQGQALMAGNWAVIVYCHRSEGLIATGDTVVKDLCAHAWQKVSGIWQLQFCSSVRPNPSLDWTPEDFEDGQAVGEWQCQIR